VHSSSVCACPGLKPRVTGVRRSVPVCRQAGSLRQDLVYDSLLRKLSCKNSKVTTKLITAGIMDALPLYNALPNAESDDRKSK